MKKYNNYNHYKNYKSCKFGVPPKKGGYASLAFYQQTEIIYDFTVEFYKRYIDKNYNDYKNYLSSPELAANAMVCLINQTNRLLDQKLRWLEEQFIKKGGYTENLFKKRLAQRQQKQTTP